MSLGMRRVSFAIRSFCFVYRAVKKDTPRKPPRCDLIQLPDIDSHVRVEAPLSFEAWLRDRAASGFVAPEVFAHSEVDFILLMSSSMRQVLFSKQHGRIFVHRAVKKDTSREPPRCDLIQLPDIDSHVRVEALLSFEARFRVQAASRFVAPGVFAQSEVDFLLLMSSSMRRVLFAILPLCFVYRAVRVSHRVAI